ncbi:hypothetical protein Clacol_002180 [Clathrus columnatus]|uniref:Protein kinase domain-containing protein n=1 Tax=Clathrus columnatus TaxID=1419009 RepID=A0AAV5A438_9AGAM|nr:hypothetical protein Clacol_002180 [Clathrus columnatus]
MSRFMKIFWWRESIPEEETSADDWKAALEAKEARIKHFWESKRGWFFDKGYTLFRFQQLRRSLPLLDTPSLNSESIEYPYAFCGGDPPYWDCQPLQAYNSEKICFAQDVEGRHIAIKKLNNTDEIHIYRLLWEKRGLLAENCILPILDILEYEGQCFAVMPRWGEPPFFLDPPITLGHVLHYIHCLLKDLKEGNTLINHFGAFSRARENSMRPKLRTAGQLTYALFDFDLALMLPSTECRLPASQSFYVLSIMLPFDTSHGELDYDPYKFEMGCLGIVLCQMFQHCIPAVPVLAPFLDRLITDRLELRFTAKEALQFFEKMHATLTPEQLSLEAPIYTLPGYPHWEPEKYNRWEGLPDEFVQEWARFRAPIPSFHTKLLRRICRTNLGGALVVYIRRFFKFLGIGTHVLLNYFRISPKI